MISMKLDITMGGRIPQLSEQKAVQAGHLNWEDCVPLTTYWAKNLSQDNFKTSKIF